MLLKKILIAICSLFLFVNTVEYTKADEIQSPEITIIKDYAEQNIKLLTYYDISSMVVYDYPEFGANLNNAKLALSQGIEGLIDTWLISASLYDGDETGIIKRDMYERLFEAVMFEAIEDTSINPQDFIVIENIDEAVEFWKDTGEVSKEMISNVIPAVKYCEYSDDLIDNTEVLKIFQDIANGSSDVLNAASMGADVGEIGLAVLYGLINKYVSDIQTVEDLSDYLCEKFGKWDNEDKIIKDAADIVIRKYSENFVEYTLYYAEDWIEDNIASIIVDSAIGSTSIVGVANTCITLSATLLGFEDTVTEYTDAVFFELIRSIAVMDLGICRAEACLKDSTYNDIVNYYKQYNLTKYITLSSLKAADEIVDKTYRGFSRKNRDVIHDLISQSIYAINNFDKNANSLEFVLASYYNEGKNIISEEDYSGYFIISDSNRRYITLDELDNLSLEEIFIARNEIYARYDFVFSNSEVQYYFNTMPWYFENPIYTDANKPNLNEYEIYNYARISNYIYSGNGSENGSRYENSSSMSAYSLKDLGFVKDTNGDFIFEQDEWYIRKYSNEDKIIFRYTNDNEEYIVVYTNPDEINLSFDNCLGAVEWCYYYYEYDYVSDRVVLYEMTTDIEGFDFAQPYEPDDMTIRTDIKVVWEEQLLYINDYCLSEFGMTCEELKILASGY